MINLTQLPQEERKYKDRVSDNPQNGEAWYLLARVYHKQQRFELAEEAYHRALSLETSVDTLYHLGEMLYDRKLYGKALDYLLKAAKLTEDKPSQKSEIDALIDAIYALDSCSL